MCNVLIASQTPDGFSKWFEYAQKNQVSRIDDYDEMMQSLESFRDAGVFFLVAGVDLPSGGADVPDVDTGSVHRAGGFFD